MDKIWYIYPAKSEVIGRCGGDEKTTQNRQKSNAKKKKEGSLWSQRWSGPELVYNSDTLLPVTMLILSNSTDSFTLHTD